MAIRQELPGSSKILRVLIGIKMFQKFFTKDGKTNSAAIRRISEEEKLDIISKSLFLENQPKLSQRLKILNLGFTSHLCCEHCDDFLPYSNNHNDSWGLCGCKIAKDKRKSPIKLVKFKKTISENKKIRSSEPISYHKMMEILKTSLPNIKNQYDVTKLLNEHIGLESAIRLNNKFPSLKVLIGMIFGMFFDGCEVCNRVTSFSSNPYKFLSHCKKHFLNKNHMQGDANSSIRYGLKYNDDLVSVITISKNRYSSKSDLELLRFATKLGFNIVGGFSKLLSHVRSNHLGSIISYANLRWSNGNVYEKNNFVKLSDSKPNYFYIEKNRLLSRLKFQRHKLNDDSERTESEIMFDRGYRRIWDCGNSVYILQ